MLLKPKLKLLRTSNKLKSKSTSLKTISYIIKRRIPKLIEKFPRKKKVVISLHTYKQTFDLEPFQQKEEKKERTPMKQNRLN